MLNSREYDAAEYVTDSEECLDCGSVDTERAESGYNDDGTRYELWQCLDEDCGCLFDAETLRICYEGSDYSDRMTERRQMGLTNF